jgi:hypothetical protein
MSDPDFDRPADPETDDNPHRNPETGEPLPADPPDGWDPDGEDD